MKAQILTPGQALDWAKGLSHQAMDVEYLIGSDGEQYYAGDILDSPEILTQLNAFVADPKLVGMSAYELTQLCSLCFKLGEDGESKEMFKKVLTNRLEELGFDNIDVVKG